MKKKVLLALITVALLFSLTLAGCGGGIPQADYDSIQAQLAEAQSKLTQALADLAQAKDGKAAAEAGLQDALDGIADLEKQIADLKALYEFEGDTLAEIVARIARNYHETHFYSKTDMFICSDMASEIWNMLKARGITSAIVIGNKDTRITDILQSNHAWVLADIGNGEKLAVETTAGTVIPRSQNANYYHGWSFTSPTDLKSNNDLIKEYNLRVGFRNLLAEEVNNALILHNNSSNQAEADKYLTLYNKLKELKDAHEEILVQLKSQIDGLAAQF